MLGFGDFWVFLAYALCVASAVYCAYYGFSRWNKVEEDEAKEISEEQKWEKDELRKEEQA